jgi:hypothetical protein
MSDAQRIPCGAWPSPITADRAASASVGLREMRAIGDPTSWLERRPQEQGRSVIVRGARGARSKTRPPAFERGRDPLVADGTYLGPVKAGRRVDVRAVNA